VLLARTFAGSKWRSLSIPKGGSAAYAANPTREKSPACRRLSAKVLHQRLAKFLRFGLVRRRVQGDKPPVEVDYALTELGGRFVVLLDSIDAMQRDLDGGYLAPQ
jgi:DNA-binding HxlR family transcriptional regulator